MHFSSASVPLRRAASPSRYLGSRRLEDATQPLFSVEKRLYCKTFGGSFGKRNEPMEAAMCLLDGEAKLKSVFFSKTVLVFGLRKYVFVEKALYSPPLPFSPPSFRQGKSFLSPRSLPKDRKLDAAAN